MTTREECQHEVTHRFPVSGRIVCIGCNHEVKPQEI